MGAPPVKPALRSPYVGAYSTALRVLRDNVRGEPVFISVMVAGWFCEKSG